MKTIAFAAITSLVLLFVWERVDIVRIGYHIERLKSQKVVLERERDELRVKLSALTAPERIARMASDKLGMVLPDKGQVVVVHVEPEIPVVPVLAERESEMKLAKNVVFRRTR
ncbi:MAG TPA: cell division protein FtsL [Nitrospiraceae bacterium]|jgi:cell division protein FtsL|nr:cell division protein FtsL [Nitrospiraceae bacterium]